RFRVSSSAEPIRSLAVPASIRQLVAIPPKDRTKRQAQQIAEVYRQLDEARKSLAAKVAGLQQEKTALERSIATTMILRERKKPRESFILVRGDFLRPGAPVTGGVPEFLP